MDRMNRPLAILNLTGALSSELKEYFISRNILVIDPLVSNAIADWTHIITKDLYDYNLINETYDLTKKDRHIISLSQVEDLQNFTINNGNLVLDDVWFKGNLGPFIMDKYFQGYGGITLGDNYPSFQELGTFNITNPFNTGEYLDRLIHKAFESGIEALTLKTYFDHLLMYVAGLKKQKKAGLPFEVTYGAYEDVFALQVHFFSEHLEILDVTTSLSSVLTKKAEEYFLNTAVQSSDFFDFSYMPSVNKVIITALWTKDARIKFENRGLMFTGLDEGLVLHKYENEGTTSSLIESRPIPDLTERLFFSTKPSPVETIKIAGKTEKEEDVAVVAGTPEVPQESTMISGTPEESQESEMISGTPEGSLESTKVPGTPDEAQESTTIPGDTEAIQEKKTISGPEENTEDEIRIIKGELNLDELVTVVKDKFEEEKSVIRIFGNKLDIDKVAYRIAAKVDDSTKESNLKVRSLGDKIPALIKTGLFDFAKNLNKPVDELDNIDIDNFQHERLPEIIKQGLIEKQNEEAIVSHSIGKPSPVQASDLLVKKMANDNDRLRAQVKSLQLEVQVLKTTRDKLAEVQQKAIEAATQEDLSEKIDTDEALRRHFTQKLKEQKELNQAELHKLSGLLERESKLMSDIKAEELKTRKLHIESVQKENLYNQEIEKSQRLIKGKDLMLIKMKETFSKLVERKESEIINLRQKNEQLSHSLATGLAQNQEKSIRLLEKQNGNLVKQLDVYKVKISSLASKINTSNGDDSKEEARKLQMLNNQLKNQLDLAKKSSDKFEKKTQQDHAQIQTLRQEKVRFEQIIKKLTLENNKPKEETIEKSPPTDSEMRRMQAQNQILENQLKESSSKMSMLEAKIQELMRPQKTLVGADDGSKVKLTQLEHSVKKLTQDIVENKNLLAEAKKETNKLRQEKTALQNQLDKLKKDVAKAKAATPQKTTRKAS